MPTSRTFLHALKPSRLGRFAMGLVLVLSLAVSALLPSFSTPTALAAPGAIARTVNYQGKLLGTSGLPVADGTYAIKFSLYTAASGGTPIWTASGTTASPVAISVTVTNGLFSVLLGDTSGAYQNGFNFDWYQDALYLGVTVSADSEMTPRKRLSSVPSAFVAETLQGQYASNAVTSTGATLMQLNQTSADQASATRTTLVITNQGTSNAFDYLLRGTNGATQDVFTISRQGNVTTTGNLAVQGNTYLGDAVSDQLVLTAHVASDIIPAADLTYTLGSSALRWLSANIGTVTATTVSSTNGIFGGVTSTFVGATTVSTTNLIINGTPFTNGSAATTATLDTIAQNGNTTTRPLYLLGDTYTRNLTATGTSNLTSVISTDLTSSFATATTLAFTNASGSSLIVSGFAVCLSNGTNCLPTAPSTSTLQDITNNGASTTNIIYALGGIQALNLTATGTLNVTGASTLGTLTFTNGTATNVTTTALNAGSITVTSGTAGTWNVGTGNINNLAWTNATGINTTSTALFSTSFQATSATITTLNAGALNANSFTTANASITGGSINGTQIGNITPSTGVFTNATATSVTTTNIFATNGTFTNLTVSTLNPTNLTWVNATGTNTTSTALFATSFQATSATIATLNMGTANAATLTVGNNFTVAGATTLQGLSATTATFNGVTTTALAFTSASGSQLFASSIQVNGSSVCLANGINCPASSSVTSTIWQENATNNTVFTTTSSRDILLGGNTTATAGFIFDSGATGTSNVIIGGSTNTNLFVGTSTYGGGLNSAFSMNGNDLLVQGMVGSVEGLFSATGVTIGTGTVVMSDSLFYKSNAGDYAFRLNNAGSNWKIFSGSSATATLTMSSSSYVGIGNAQPREALDVTGNIRNLYNTGDVPVLISSTTLGNSAGPGNLQVQGKYGYIANFSNSTVATFDVSNPSAPVQIATTTFPSGSGTFGLAVAGSYAYVTQFSTKIFNIIDISKPASPVTVGTTTIAGGQGLYGIAVSGRYAYVTHDSVLNVIDVSNATAPIITASTTLGSALQTLGVTIQGRYVYVANFSGDSMSVVDVSNPSTPVLVGTKTYAAGTNPREIVANGRYVYVANSGLASLSIVDVSNPAAPVGVGTTTFSNTADLRGLYSAGRYAYVGSFGSSTLSVIDVSAPTAPVNLGTVSFGSGLQTRNVIVDGRYVYVVQFAGNALNILTIPGLETASLSAHSAEIGMLSVLSSAEVSNNLTVGGSLMVDGGGIYTQGSLAVMATSTTSTFNGAVSGTVAEFSSRITIKGISVCLADGTNCVATAATTTAWQENATNNTIFTTTSSRDILLGGNTTATAGFIFDSGATGTSSVIIGGSTNTNLFVGTSTYTGGLALAFSMNGNDALVQGQMGIMGGLYAGTLNVTGTIDNTMASGTPTFTILASTTLAGNANPTRIALSGKYAYITNAANAVSVVDVSQPGNPSLVVTKTLGTGLLTNDIVVGGSYAYVGNFNASSVSVLDISNPSNPVVVATSSLNPSYKPRGLFLAGRYLYVTAIQSVTGQGPDYINIVDVSNPTQPITVGSSTLPQIGLFGPQPYQVYVQGRYAYSANSGNNTMSVIDVSNPALPVVTATATFSSGSNPETIFVQGRYAYIGQSGNGVFNVLDISNPRSPVIVGTSTVPGTSLASTLQVSGRYAYLTRQTGNQFIAFDVQDPTRPIIVASTTLPGAGPIGLAISGGYAYIANITAGSFNVLRIPGIETSSLVAHDAEIGTLSVLNNASIYNNLTVGGGLIVDGSGIYSQGSLAVMATNTTSTFNGAVSGTQGEFSRYLSVKGVKVCLADGTNCTGTSATTTNIWQENSAINAVYLTTSTRNVGIGNSSPTEALDVTGNIRNMISSAKPPVIVATTTFVGTVSINNLAIQGNYLYAVNFGGDKLYIMDVANKASPVVLSTTTFATGAGPDFVEVVGRYAYVALYNHNALNIFDISNPSAPVLTASTSLRTPARMVANGRYLYAVSSRLGPYNLAIYDVSDPTKFNLVGTVPEVSGNTAYDLYVQGRYAYITNQGNDTFDVIDVSSPSAPFRVSTLGLNSGSDPLMFDVAGHYAYVNDVGNNTLNVIDLTSSTAPVVVATRTYIGLADRIKVNGGYLYSALFSNDDLLVFDITNPSNPVEVATATMPSTADPSSVVVSGRYAYVAGTYINMFKLPGIETASIQAHGAQLGALNVDANADIGNRLTVGGGLFVGADGIYSQGALAIMATNTTSTFNGSVSGTNAEFSNSVTVQGVKVCLANGSNCPAAAPGTATSTNIWQESTTNNTVYLTTSSRDVLLGGSTTATAGFIFDSGATDTSNVIIGGSTNTNLFVGTSTYGGGLNSAFSMDGNDILAQGMIGSIGGLFSATGVTIGTGTVVMSDSLFYKNNAGDYAFRLNNAGSNWKFYSGSGTATATLAMASSGYVGIGTENPSEALQVNGSLISGMQNGAMPKIVSSTNVSPVAIPTDQTRIISKGGTTVIRVSTSTPLGNGFAIYTADAKGYPTYVTATLSNTPYFETHYDFDGKYIYVLTSTSTVLNRYLNINVYDVSNPSQPITHVVPSGAVATTTALQTFMAIDGKYLLIGASPGSANGQGVLYVYDRSNPIAPTFVASTTMPVTSTLEGIVRGNYLYVDSPTSFAPGAKGQLVTFDLQDHSRPTYVTTTVTPDHSEYFAVSNGYAYMNSLDGIGTMVVDLKDPANPLYVSTTLQNYVLNKVEVAGRYAFSDDQGNNISVYDLITPTAPRFIGTLPYPITCTNPGDCFVYGMTVTGKYLQAVYGNFSNNTYVLATYAIPGVETSGLLADTAWIDQLSVGGNADVSSRLTVGGQLIVSAGGIFSQGSLAVGSTNTTSTFNGAVSGTTATFSSIYVAGASVCLSNGSNCPAGTATTTNIWQESATNNAVYLTTSTRFVGIGTATPHANLDVRGNIENLVTSGTELHIASTTLVGDGPNSIFVSGRYAYVANNGGDTLSIVDISNSSAPRTVSTVATGDQPFAVQVVGRYAFVANVTGQTLSIFDVSNPTSPVTVSTYTLGFGPTSLFVSGRYAYVVGGSNSLLVLDISNPASPISVSTVNVGSVPFYVYVNGSYAYVANLSGNSVSVVNISNPALPVVVGTQTVSQPGTLFADGNYVYVTSFNGNTFSILNVSNPSSPTLSAAVSSTSAAGVYVNGRYAYVTDFGNDALTVFDISSSTLPIRVATTTVGDGPAPVFVSGRYAYVGNVTADSMSIVQLPGMETASLLAHSAEVGSFSVIGSAQVGNQLSVNGGLDVGIGGIYSQGAIGVMATNTTSTFNGAVSGTSAEFSNYLSVKGVKVCLENGANCPATAPGSATTTDIWQYSYTNNTVSLTTSSADVLLGGSTTDTAGFIFDSGATGTSAVIIGGATNTNLFIGALEYTGGLNPEFSMNGNDVFAQGMIGSIEGLFSATGVTIGTNSVVISDTTFVKHDAGDYSFRMNDTSSNWKFFTGNSVTSSLTVASSGNIGIGNMNPTEALDVKGSIHNTLGVGGVLKEIAAPIPGLGGGANGVFKSGKYAYMTVGGDNFLAIYDVSLPDAPLLLSTTTVGASPRHPFVSGKYAFVPNNDDNTISILDISNPSLPTTVSTPSVGNGPTSVFVQGRYAYMVGNQDTNFHVLDISNPSSVVEVGTFSTGCGSYSVVVRGRYAYIGCLGGSFNIVDVSIPSSPSSVSTISVGSNVFGIDVKGIYAYTSNYDSNSMSIIDVSDPTTPVVRSTTPVTEYPSWVAVEGKYAYFSNSNAGIVSIFDISSSTAPVYIGDSPVPHIAGSANQIAVDGRYAYVAGNNGALSILELPGMESTWLTSDQGADIATNLTVGGDADVKGSITDIITSSSIETVASAAVGTNPSAVFVSGRYTYVANFGSATVSILDTSDPSVPKLLADVSVGPGPVTLFVSGHYLYVGNASDNTVSIVDVKDPIGWSVVATLNVGLGPTSIFVSGRYAYVTNENDNTFTVIDVSDPTAPAIVATPATNSGPQAIFVKGHYAYVADSAANDLYIFDVTNPASPSFLTNIAVGSNPRALYVSGRYAYVVNTSDGTITILDIANPGSPSVVSTAPVGTTPTAIFVSGRYAFVANSGDNTISVLDVSDPKLPVTVSIESVGSNPNGIFVNGRYVYVTNNLSASVSVLKLPGIETASVFANTAELGSLSVIGDAGVDGRLTVGENLDVTGHISAFGASFKGFVSSTQIHAAVIEVNGVSVCLADGTNCQTAAIGDVRIGAGHALTGVALAPVGTDPRSVFVDGRYAYVANNGADTLSILDISIASTTNVVSTIGVGAAPIDVFVSGKYAYVANLNSANLSIIDISNPKFPVTVTTTPVGDNPRSVYVNGRYAYVALEIGTTAVLDVSNPHAPTLLSTYDVGNNPYAVFVRGEYAYTANNTTANVSIANISDPYHPILVATATVTGTSPRSIYVSGRYLYTVGLNQGNSFFITDISDPSNPVLVYQGDDGDADPTSIYVSGQYAYITNHDNGDTPIFTLRVLDISSSTSPVLVDTVALGGPWDVFVSGRYAYVAQDNGFLGVYKNPGFDTASIYADTAAVGQLSVVGNAQVENRLDVGDSMTVGAGGINSQGPVAVAGDIMNLLSTTSTLPTVATLATADQPRAIFVRGKYAYVANTGAGSLDIIDISNVAAPVTVASLGVGNSPEAVYVSGGYAYIANYADNNVNIIDVSNPAVPIFVSQPAVGTQPHSVFVSGHYLYVANVVSNDVSILDVSNPYAPVTVATLPVGVGPNALYVSGHYAYTANSGDDSISVIDISNPTAPSIVSTPSVAAGPVYITVNGHYAYVSHLNLRTVSILNIADPSSVTLVGTANVGETPLGTFVSGRYLYVVNNGDNDLSVVDVADPANPVTIATAPVGDTPFTVFVSGKYAYVTNNNDDTISVLKLQGMETTSLVAHSAEVGTLSVLADANIENTLSVGDGLTVGPGGIKSRGSLQVSGDIGNTLQVGAPLKTVTTTNIGADAYSSFVSGRYIYVVKGTTDELEILDISTPSNPVMVSTVGVGDIPYSVYVSGRYAYVVNAGTDDVSILDVSDPVNPSLISTPTVGDNPFGSFVSGRYLYVTNYADGSLSILDVSNPTAPVTVSVTAVSTGPNSIFVSGRYAYVANQAGGSVSILDVTDPANPGLILSFGVGPSPNSIFVRGRYLYLVNGNNNLSIWDVTDPNTPVAFPDTSVGTQPTSVFVSGHYAYVANRSSDSVSVVDVSDPRTPLFISSSVVTGGPQTVFVSGHYAYVANQIAGTLVTLQIPGIDTSSLFADSAKFGLLDIAGDASVENTLTVGHDLTVGAGGIYSQGSLTITSPVVATNTAYIVNSAANTVAVLNVQGGCSNGDGATDLMLVGNSTDNRKFSVRCNGDVFADGAYAGTGADFAEYFRLSSAASSSAALYTSGTVVTLSNASTVTMGMRSLRSQTLGVISTNPGVVGNAGAIATDPKARIIGLIGQIPTKASTALGAIAAGDVLMVGDNGVAVKARGPGMVIGTAMEPLNSGTGVIMTLVSPHYWAGDVLIDTASAVADLSTPLVNSPLFSLTGSFWDSGSSAAKDVSFGQQVQTLSATSSALAFMGPTGTQLMTISNVGNVSVSGDLTVGHRLYLGSKVGGTGSTSTYLFVDDTLSPSSTYISTNADGFVAQTSYDYAERYVSDDTLEAGDLVAIDPLSSEKVKRVTDPKADIPVGIVSTKPGFITGGYKEGTYPIALAGRVPVKVSTANGAIKVGDALTASNMPGVAVKAVGPGYIVGLALESYDLPEIGTVVAFVRTGYHLGMTSADGALAEAPTYADKASGLATVRAGSKEVRVNFQSVGSYPIISLAPYGEAPVYWLTKVSDASFTIILKDAPSIDLVFSWSVQASKAGSVMYYSDNTTAPYDPMTGNPVGPVPMSTSTPAVPTSTSSTTSTPATRPAAHPAPAPTPAPTPASAPATTTQPVIPVTPATTTTPVVTTGSSTSP